MNGLTQEEIKELKQKFTTGTRIMLISMADDIHPIPPKTKGTVIFVDDIGTVHCNFDNGRSLGLIMGEDEFEKID